MTECVNAAHRGACLLLSTPPPKKKFYFFMHPAYLEILSEPKPASLTKYGDMKKGMWLIAYDVITLEKTRSWEWEPTKEKERLRTKNGQDRGVRKTGSSVKTWMKIYVQVRVDAFYWYHTGIMSYVTWRRTVIVPCVFAWILSHYCLYEKICVF